MRRRLLAAAGLGVLAAPVTAAPDVIPTAVAAAAAHDDLERAVVRRINEQRTRRDLPILRTSSALARTAARHSVRQLRRDRLSHRALGSRMRRAVSARRVGEVVAFVPSGTRRRARTVVRMWMRSPSHRRVLLTRSFRRVGVGRRYGSLGGRPGTVMTADFASRPR